jgi:hypothetical protein
MLHRCQSPRAMTMAYANFTAAEDFVRRSTRISSESVIM